MNTSYRHDAIIDIMLTCPHMNLGDIANSLGYSRAWLSTLTKSDAFQMRLHERRAHFEAGLEADSYQRLHELDKKASEIIQKELEKSDADPNFALSVKKTVQQNMGGKKVVVQGDLVAGNKPTQINTNVLERARQKMRNIEQSSAVDDLPGQVLDQPV